MGLLNVIRTLRLRHGLAIREIARRTGLSRNTIKKHLKAGTVEPQFATPERHSKIDPFWPCGPKRHGPRQLSDERPGHGARRPATGPVLRRPAADFLAAVDMRPRENRKAQGRWWPCPARRQCRRGPARDPRRHTAFGLGRSGAGPDPRRCASRVAVWRVSRWRRSASRAEPGHDLRAANRWSPLHDRQGSALMTEIDLVGARHAG